MRAETVLLYVHMHSFGEADSGCGHVTGVRVIDRKVFVMFGQKSGLLMKMAAVLSI